MPAPHTRPPRAAPRTLALVPSYDNPRSVGPTVERVLAQGLPVLLVDDGSAPEGRAACERAAQHPRVTLLRRARNGGKGAAVLDGLARARELGFSHAFQIDGDGQHEIERAPAFLEASRERPEALVLGAPVYAADAPRHRLIARRITTFWVHLEVPRGVRVPDAMIGFRIYPLAEALAAGARCRRMDFDVEILVLMARRGVPLVSLPVGLRYPSAAEGGVSHFHQVRDNARFFALHARLCTGGALAHLGRRLRGALPRRSHP